VPSAAVPQIPFCPPPFFPIVQAAQTASHAVSQQVLSTQWPEEHAESAVQGLPIGCPVPHAPLMQSSPWQSAFVVHDERQAAPEQLYE